MDLSQFKLDLGQIDFETREKIKTVEDQARKVFLVCLKVECKMPLLQKYIDRLSNSKDLSHDENGELIQCEHVDFSDIIDLSCPLQKKFLAEYLRDEYQMDWNGRGEMSYQIGPAIIIDQQGNIYDQEARKAVCDSIEYRTIEERNALIEAYMEKTGHYPPVVQCDRLSGFYHYVDTTKKG